MAETISMKFGRDKLMTQATVYEVAIKAASA